jgi:tRNA(adenine34) deaminase
MCAGAILQARVGRLVYGTRNHLLGADGSWLAMFPARDGDGRRSGDGEALPPQRPHPFHPEIAVRRLQSLGTRFHFS